MMSILTHFLVLSVYSAIVFAVLRPKLQFGENPCRMANAEETQVYSPAREVLPLRVQVDERDIRGEYPTSPFAGNPGAETDGAWRHLLRGSAFPTIAANVAGGCSDDRLLQSREQYPDRKG